MTSQLAKKVEVQPARFSESASDLIKRYTASVFLDKRLTLFDIQGSLVHAVVLAKQGIITETDRVAVEQSMAQIRREIETGTFEWRLDLENVHLNIEARLTTAAGDAGERLHAGHSRNSQTTTDIHLWLRSEIDNIVGLLKTLRGALLNLAEQHANTIIPGFTHLQAAQPMVFGRHLSVYVKMFTRDTEHMLDACRRANRLSLGAAALAGTSYPVDREFVAQQLGSEGVYRSSLDAVSDRGSAIEFCAAAALIMTHVSRFSEELVLWMSPRVDFIDIADRFCMGSSTMPQKKNPDVSKLIRGGTGRINGRLIDLLTLIKGQPLACNKDNQEDKEPLFDTVDTVVDTLRISADIVPSITVKTDATRATTLQGYAAATGLAGYLVKRGLPFRDAHEAVAHAVHAYDDLHYGLTGLSVVQPRDIRGLSDRANLIGNDMHTVLTLEGSATSRDHIGGTAPERVKQTIAFARATLAE